MTIARKGQHACCRCFSLFAAVVFLAAVIAGPPAAAQNGTITVPAGSGPNVVAVNPVTNKVYVANQGSDNVMVIDGVTNATTTVATGSIPIAIAANPVTNKIYVANVGSNNVTVIDGATNESATVPAGTLP